MIEPPSSSDSWIHLGICPVCQSGLCRVRLCGVAQGHWHGLVVCDECEAMWTEPDTTKPPLFGSPEVLCSPITGEEIWPEPNRWATLEDVALLGWLNRVIVQPKQDTQSTCDLTLGQDEPKPGC